MVKKKVATTELLEDVVNKTSADKIAIGDLIAAMDSGGFGLVMTIFSLPIIIPLPPPFPSFVAIPMIVFSLQMVFGLKSPKLPKVISRLSIKRTILAKMIEKSAPHIMKAEGLIRPRLLVLSSDFFKKVIGFFCLLFSISVLMPIPLSNLIPGIGVIITAFGLLGRDGIIIISGLLIGSLGVATTIITVLLGAQAFNFILNLF